MTSFHELAAHCPTNRAAWASVRKHLRATTAKGDSDRLFNAVIREMQWFLAQTGSIDWIEGYYRDSASRRVNNTRSSFYLYGR